MCSFQEALQFFSLARNCFSVVQLTDCKLKLTSTIFFTKTINYGNIFCHTLSLKDRVWTVCLSYNLICRKSEELYKLFNTPSFLHFLSGLSKKYHLDSLFIHNLEKNRMATENSRWKQSVLSTNLLNPGILREDSSNFHFCCSLSQGKQY